MAAAGRTNQYFIPGEGIIREVIQADICRYLGNDALVRPGNYQGRDGFFITAYRNLTSEMISDLKNDSQRWSVERQEGEARGYRVTYPSSSTHQSRHYWGPTSTSGPPPPGQAGAVYAPQGAPPQSSAYDQGGYTYGQPPGGYPPQGAPYGYPADQYGAQAQPRASPLVYAPTDGQDRGVPSRDQDPGYGYSPGGQQAQVPRSSIPQQSASRAAQQQQQQVPTSRSAQPQPPVARSNQQYQPRDPYQGRGGYN